MPLPDEGERAPRVVRLVGELDEAGLLERAAVHAEDAAQALLGDLGRAEHGDGEVLAVGDVDGDLGQGGRGEGAAGRVHEVAGEVLALGDAGALGHGGDDLLAALAHHDDPLGAGRAGLGAQLGVAVGTQAGTLGHGPGGDGLLGGGGVGDDVEERQGHRRDPAARPHDLGGGTTQAGRVDRGGRAEAHRDERTTVGAGDDGDLVGLAGEALGGEHPGGETEGLEPVGVALLGGDGDGDELDVVGQVLGVLDHGRHVGLLGSFCQVGTGSCRAFTSPAT